MAAFDKYNELLNNVLNELVTDQDLCKLIYYKSKTPLNEPNINGEDLLFDNIFPYPFNPDSLSENTSLLTVMIDNIIGEKNVFVGSIIKFNIIVHDSLWHISGGLRPFSIMARIDKLMNRNRDIGGISEVKFKNSKYMYFNDNYMGYVMSYEITEYNV